MVGKADEGAGSNAKHTALAASGTSPTSAPDISWQTNGGLVPGARISDKVSSEVEVFEVLESAESSEQDRHACRHRWLRSEFGRRERASEGGERE
eukprot:2125452-Rhodomonas_salina.1